MRTLRLLLFVVMAGAAFTGCTDPTGPSSCDAEAVCGFPTSGT